MCNAIDLLHCADIYRRETEFKAITSVLFVRSGVPRIFFRGGSTNSVEDRENGDLGVVAP